MSSTEENEAIRKIVEHCRSLTLSLASLSDTNEPQGVASGFLVSVDNSIYLISAGHALKKGRWVVETGFKIEREFQTACIPINAPWALKRIKLGQPKVEDVDVSWAKIDLVAFQDSVRKDIRLKGMSFEYVVYQGPLDDTPSPDEPYIYSSWNQALVISAVGKTYLERDFSYEFEMQFKRLDPKTGLYVFSIPKHKGHDHYRGASGSPICSPEGKVVAILVSGEVSKNELYGFPTRGLNQLIKMGAEADRIHDASHESPAP